MAQDYRAKVQGVITDTSQGAVAGAQVTLLNTKTGVATQRNTNETGAYLFDFVDPGIYTVTAERTGFSKTVQGNVAVQVRGDITVNLALKVGATTEAITVGSEVPAVEFNTSTLSMTIPEKTITEVPSVGRNPFTLAQLDPVAVSRWSTPANQTVYNTYSSTSTDIGGSNSRANDVQLDGAPIGIGTKGSWAPAMDAVQEVAVQQNAVDAEFGHSAGGVVTLAMKSGTNEFHGDVSYAGRNPALNAQTNSLVHTKSQARSYFWGGVIGHPVIRNKLFNFFSFERQKVNSPYTTQVTLPTEMERGGDFSQAYSAQGAQRVIYDPWTTTFNATTGAVTRTPFVGNTIPATRMDATSLRVLKQIWLPNGPGTNASGVNNFQSGYVERLTHDNIGERADWNVNSNWKVFGRYGRFRAPLTTTDYSGTKSTAMARWDDGVTYSRNIAADAVYTMNSRTVLNFRFSYVALHSYYGSDVNNIGTSGLASLWPDNAWYKSYLTGLPAVYYPYISVSGVGSFTTSRSSQWYQYPETYNYSGRMSKAFDKHYLKAGYESRILGGNAMMPALMSFSFPASLTANTFQSPNTATSGDAWATFLLGALDSGSSAQTIPQQEVRLNYYALYVQDEFKVNRRLTLNAGLRWEYEPGAYDPDNRLSRYLDLTNPIPEMAASAPAIPSSVTAIGEGLTYKWNGAWNFTDSKNRHMWNGQKRNLAPRVGAAYRIDDRTALRVGYARYITSTITTVDVLGSQSYPGYTQSTTVAASLQGIPGATFSDPFPSSSNPLIAPIGKGYGRYTNLGGAASWGNNNLKNPVNDRFNVSLQRQLPFKVAVDATYFVNQSRNMPYSQNLNQVNPQLYYDYKSLTAASVANPFYGYLTATTFPGALRNQATVSADALLKPYPQYSSLTQTGTNGVKSRYQALQLKVQRPFENGLSLLAGYSYDHLKSSNFFNSDDQYAGKFTYLNATYPRHRLTTVLIYALPFGKGRTYMNHANRVVNGILGGWSMTGNLVATSGSFLQFGAMVANGNPVLANPTPKRWFDTSVFSVLPSYTKRTNPWQYSGLTGPANWNLDAAVSKSFPIKERVRMEFRVEAFNATNSFIPTDPDVSVTSATFGQSTGMANVGRQLQYTLKLHF